MLILMYMPVIALSMIVEAQLRGKPYDLLSFDRPEYFGRHLMRLHLWVASFCAAFAVTALFSS